MSDHSCDDCCDRDEAERAEHPRRYRERHSVIDEGSDGYTLAKCLGCPHRGEEKSDD